MIGDGQRLVVCVGTGGVGKTTIAATIALGAALHGRRAIVLTIDPARALARALGLEGLAPEGEVIPLDAPGTLAAAMLDQKRAWDAFVAHHAPDPAAARVLLANPFYERLSRSFAGSTEYMAIEEMCRLSETGGYDLVVLDTPPSAHAIDFLRAPERIDRLLAERRDFGMTRFVTRQLERAAGSATLHEIATFFTAMSALVVGVRARTRRARALLRSAAFVLVTGPRPSILDDTRSLAEALRVYEAPLAAVVVNRTHPRITSRLDVTGDPIGRWLRARFDEAVAEADAEARILEPFLASLPAGVARALVPEIHPSEGLHDLVDLVTHLDIDHSRSACA